MAIGVTAPVPISTGWSMGVGASGTTSGGAGTTWAAGAGVASGEGMEAATALPVSASAAGLIRTSTTPSTSARARNSSGSQSATRNTVNRDSGSTSSSRSAGGSVPRTLALEDRRFKTSRAFMSARGRSASKTTVSAMPLGSTNSSASAAGCDGLARGRGRGRVQGGLDQRGQPREIDRALTLGAEVTMVIPQLVEAAKRQVQRRTVECPFLAPELFEQALHVVGQPVDRREPHDHGGALDAVEHPEGFLKRLRVGRVLLEPQERSR